MQEGLHPKDRGTKGQSQLPSGGASICRKAIANHYHNAYVMPHTRTESRMSVTILAIIFLAFVLAVSLFGFKAVIRQGKRPEDVNKEKCSLCRQMLPKSQLIERQIGDTRVLFFCPSCVTALYNELTRKN